MAQITDSSTCWIDLYDSNYFRGKLRRLAGPRMLRQLQAKSLIVGPHAAVRVSVRRGGTESVITLDPKCVIPDLAKSLPGKIVRTAVVRSN
jgi:hypothetical protein